MLRVSYASPIPSGMCVFFDREELWPLALSGSHGQLLCSRDSSRLPPRPSRRTQSGRRHRPAAVASGGADRSCSPPTVCACGCSFTHLLRVNLNNSGNPSGGCNLTSRCVPRTKMKYVLTVAASRLRPCPRLLELLSG